MTDNNNNKKKKDDDGDQSKKLQLMNVSDENEIQVQPRQVREGLSHNLSLTELCMQEVDDEEEEEEDDTDKVKVDVKQESAAASAEEQSNLFEGMRSFFSSSSSSPVSSNSNQNDNLTRNDLQVAKCKRRSRDIEEAKEEIQEETHNDKIISELLFMHNSVATPPPPEGEFETKDCAANTIENSTCISTPASESDLPISIIHVRNKKYDYYGDITTNHQQQVLWDDIHIEEEIVFESNPKHDYCKNNDGDDKIHPPSKASKRNGLYGFICFFLIFIAIGFWLLISFAPSSSTTEEYTDDDHQVNTPTSNDNHNNGNIDDNTDSEDGIIIITDVFDYLLQLIAPISGPDIFIGINSPQVKALDWLANEDGYVQSLLSSSISSNILNDLDTTLLERYTLVTFYFATGGIIGGSSGSISTSKKEGSSSNNTNENNEIGWLDSMRFLTSSSVCEWGGTANVKEDTSSSSSSTTTSNNEIGCNEKGHVNKVWIESNHLAGTIPNEFSVLTNLETVSLANNMLQKTIPESFQQLSRLSFFQVASNNLSGTFSNSFLRGWKQNMEIMSFYGNQFHGTIPDLGQFSNLEVVDFAHNLLTGSIPSLGSSSSTLRMIFLEENYLEGSIPDSIYDQTSLEILSLNDNFLAGTINTRVGDLAVLYSLDLSSNHGLSGSLPVAFSRLQSLSRLKLTDTNITDGLEQAFCEQHNILTTSIDADCSGMDPKVSCSCCTTCCTGTSTTTTTKSSSIDEDEGGGDFDAMINRSAPPSSSPNCTVRVPSICRLQAGRFESNSERNATCTCTDDGAHFSCQDSPRCLSCNLDHTLCAANKGYGYSFDIVTGETKKFQNHIRYVWGPWSDFTLTYLHDRGGRCEMFVNGGRCRSCLSVNCDDGDDGIHILCDNLMGGYNFNSCEEGNVSRSTGYLEILHVITESHLSGCPLLLE